VGKDGLVHAVETGFTSLASGPFDHDVKATYVTNIEKLLAENAHTAGH
jgi:hypothetical protein